MVAVPLATFSSARAKGDRGVFQLANYNNEDKIRATFNVRKYRDHAFAVLTWRETGEIVVLEAQGIALDVVLGPVRKMK